MITLSIGRAFVATLSGVATAIAMIFIFYGKFIINFNIFNILVISGILIFGYFVRLFLAILIGLISFWIVEIDGLYNFCNIIIRFLSGSYFPVSLLPVAIFKINLFFPFAYLIFMPAQLYLNKINLREGIFGFIIEIMWLIILYILLRVIWKFGLKKYESVGI